MVVGVVRTVVWRAMVRRTVVRRAVVGRAIVGRTVVWWLVATAGDLAMLKVPQLVANPGLGIVGGIPEVVGGISAVLVDRGKCFVDCVTTSVYSMVVGLLQILEQVFGRDLWKLAQDRVIWLPVMVFDGELVQHLLVWDDEGSAESSQRQDVRELHLCSGEG